MHVQKQVNILLQKFFSLIFGQGPLPDPELFPVNLLFFSPAHVDWVIGTSHKKLFLGIIFFGCTFYGGHMYIFEISMKRRIF